MTKRNLLNLVLLIFVLILILFIFYQTNKKTIITPPILTKLKAENINHIKINRISNDTSEQIIELAKTSSGWLMLRPYQLAANTFRIESILKLLNAVSLSKNDLTKLNKSTFGLDKPAVRISFNNKTTIAFGHNKSLKNHRYIQISSDLHMIADTFFYQLVAKSESYLSHKLLPEKSKITRLTLPNLSLKKTERKWQVTPDVREVSPDSINQLISEWQLSQAYDVKTTSSKSIEKSDISIELENKKVLNFKIKNDKNSFELLNLNSGVQYILAIEQKDKLLKLLSIHHDDRL